MNRDEAKFVLQGYRGDDIASQDPVIKDALELADRDVELREWLEREMAMDRTIETKFDAIAPPPGLRDAILAGSRASRPATPRRKRPVWFAAAAAVTLLLSVGSFVRFNRVSTSPLTAAALSAFATKDLQERPHNHEYAGELADIQERLSTENEPFMQSLDIDAKVVAKAGCLAGKIGSREVFEICFKRDGIWYHVYVSPLNGSSQSGPKSVPLFTEEGQFATATWSDGRNLYTLASRNGVESVKRLV
jgi:hypothetical protein